MNDMNLSASTSTTTTYLFWLPSKKIHETCQGKTVNKNATYLDSIMCHLFLKLREKRDIRE